MFQLISVESFNNKEIALETERLIIRILLPENIAHSYVQGINDPEVYKYLLMQGKGKQTIESIKDYVLKNLNSPDALLFGIYVKRGNDLIGTTRLSGISFFHYYCDIGACIFSRKHWGKGYASEALKKVVEFTFNDLGMHYIEAGVFSENTASLDLFLQSGFKIRNSYSDKLRLNNKFVEVTILYIINANFDYNKLTLPTYLRNA